MKLFIVLLFVGLSTCTDCLYGTYTYAHGSTIYQGWEEFLCCDGAWTRTKSLVVARCDSNMKKAFMDNLRYMSDIYSALVYANQSWDNYDSLLDTTWSYCGLYDSHPIYHLINRTNSKIFNGMFIAREQLKVENLPYGMFHSAIRAGYHRVRILVTTSNTTGDDLRREFPHLYA